MSLTVKQKKTKPEDSDGCGVLLDSALVLV